LPVLLVAKSGLNGVESTDRFKVNSRMLWARTAGIEAGSSRARRRPESDVYDIEAIYWTLDAASG